MKKKVPPMIHQYMSEMGKKGGSKGGTASAEALTPKQRAERARKAAWKRELKRIAAWLLEYSRTEKWREADPNGEIGHFAGHAAEYIENGWYLKSAAKKAKGK